MNWIRRLFAHGKSYPEKRPERQRVLLIGDSITDAGRDRKKMTDLGRGYPLLIAAELDKRYPGKYEVINRGVSGNQIPDLKARWERDCLALHPDIVSILVGINDTWHHLEDETFGTLESLERFEQGYRELLQQLHQQGIRKILLLEPFVLPEPSDRQKWRIDLDPKIQVVRQLANEYHAVFVPLDGEMNARGIRDGFSLYTGKDGVHPTIAGHGVITEQWLYYGKTFL